MDSRDDCLDIFRDIDVDRLGAVSLDEFRVLNTYLTEKESDCLRKFANYLLIQFDDFKVAFGKIFDVDKTGDVDRATFVKACDGIGTANIIESIESKC